MAYVIYLICLLIVHPNNLLSTGKPITSAITYDFSGPGGRLGDNLLAYLHAKWVSYKYKIPLLYRRFPYSDQLMIDIKESHSWHCANPIYKNNIPAFNRNKLIKLEAFNRTIYTIPYFPEKVGVKTHPNYPYFEVNWDDPFFLKIIRGLIKPSKKLQCILPPSSHISIAVHIRRFEPKKPIRNGLSNKQFDPQKKYADAIWPLKFAPDSYYLDQLKYVINMYPTDKIYVFIFTDDPNPANIAQYYKNIINDERVLFDYRKKNKAEETVLEDMFSMLNFDCFIHSDSNLAVVISKLGNFKVRISPTSYHWDNNNLIIDTVEIKIKK